MSPTMFVGRIMLPAVGVILAAALTWCLVQSHIGGPQAVPVSRPAASLSPTHGRITAEGRLVAYPGAEVTVGTEVMGTIVNLPVREKMAVRKGDLLAEVRAEEVKAAVLEARQRLIEAGAGLRLEQVRARLDRIMPVGATNQPQEQDLRRELLAAASAHRDAAKAAIDRFEAEPAKYRIVAPIDGVVVARHVGAGETINAAGALVTIVDLSRLRVEAEVDEFDIAGIVLKAEATITAEGYPDRRWRGEVEEIADAVVARMTRPRDPGRPADTRVLLVKVAFREPCPLKLGQRIEVEIVRQNADP
jgi:HlyD family secretion protein